MTPSCFALQLLGVDGRPQKAVRDYSGNKGDFLDAKDASVAMNKVQSIHFVLSERMREEEWLEREE